MAIIVDALDADGKLLVLTAGSAFALDYVITKDGVTYNLTGKTVLATVRAEDDPQEVVHANFEDMTATPGAGTTAAASGGVATTVSAADSARLGPLGAGSVERVKKYLVHSKVTTDNYKVTQVLRFGIRSDID